MLGGEERGGKRESELVYLFISSSSSTSSLFPSKKTKTKNKKQLTVAGAVNLELARDLVQRVRQARHQPRLDELGLSALERRLLLDGERRRLHAELLNLVVASLEGLEVRGALLDDGAGVGDAGALDLEVGEALELVEGDSVDGGGLF